MKRCIGVIGLGRMGLPISENLIERGFAVVGYRRHPSAELVALGGAMAESPADLAARADVVLSILPGLDALREVIDGPSGTLKALRPGTVHIEMSTTDVAGKAALRELVRAAGGELLDAPISGSPGMVRPRLATTFASGAEAAVDDVADVLDAISGPWVRAGEFGCGAHFKYVANLLLAVHTVAAAEAMALARSAGLDLEVVQRTLNESIGGSMAWKRFGPRMRQREWLPAPGPIETLHAILEQIQPYARDVGVLTPTLDSAKRLFDEAVASGRGHLDVSSVYDQVASAGVPADDLPQASR
jgi:putative dehydrogenase